MAQVMSNEKVKRSVTQDDWKRTQLRIPVEMYENTLAYAERNNISLNTAVLEFIENGLSIENSLTQGKNINLIFFPKNSVKKDEHVNETSISQIRAFFSVNSRYELINIESKSDGFICWYYNTDEKAPEFNNQYNDFKVFIYIEIPEDIETPFYFPPIIDHISKTYRSVINFRSIEPISGNYHYVKMTFDLLKTYPVAYHIELEKTLKSIIFNGTGFNSKINFEKIK